MTPLTTKSIRIESSLWNQFVILCRVRGITVSKRIEQLVQKELATEDPQGKILEIGKN